MLRNGAAPPPAFPADLIVPPHRGAVITAAAWPAMMVPLGAPVMPPKQPRKAKASPAVPARPDASEIERAHALALPPATELPQTDDLRPTPVAETPIPRALALTVRRQGFVDVLADSLIAMGVRLARWSASRRRAHAERERIVRANARHRAMVAQMDALKALRERIKTSG